MFHCHEMYLKPSKIHRYYKLDLAHFYIAPGLAFQGLLKLAFENYEHEKSVCELCLDEFKRELLRDIDMLFMLEKGIRDGITEAVKHDAKANNT